MATRLLILLARRRREEMAMNMNICRFCGCTESQARADAMVLGLNDEFERGLYSCCQLVAWADEQWLAWTEAALEDGKPLDKVTSLLRSIQRSRNRYLCGSVVKASKETNRVPGSSNREAGVMLRRILTIDVRS